MTTTSVDISVAADHFHLPCLIQPRNFALPLHVFARRLTVTDGVTPQPWRSSVQSSSSSSSAGQLPLYWLEMSGRRESTPLADVGGVKC